MSSAGGVTSGVNAPLRVQFVHGLESSPASSKAMYLGTHFVARTPAMDTTDFDGSVAAQADHVAAFAPDILVGSSFGGAVALALLQRGVFRGGVVLLAPAHRHFGVPEQIPVAIPVVIVHGFRDDIVSIEGSRGLALTGTPGMVELVEVDDEHRLATLLVGDALASLVRRAYSLGQ